MGEDGIVVVGCHWYERQNELTYLARAIAGAASRWNPVSVLAPGECGRRDPDGAFDIEGMGGDGAYRWPGTLSTDCTVVVDDLVPEVETLLSNVHPRSVFYLARSADALDPSWQRLPLHDHDEGHPFVMVYVPVNALAERHRHNGFGFTGYTLVLSGRTGSHDDPPPLAAWLTAAFHDSYVVIVENGIASAWRGRALRGKVPVDTRMDLWRLIAHAKVCIDLAPGRHLARECVESLRFGTPIIVPEGSGAGVAHAAASGGSTYADPEELLEAAVAMQDESFRSALSGQGRHYADANYGDPVRFTATLREALFGG